MKFITEYNDFLDFDNFDDFDIEENIPNALWDLNFLYYLNIMTGNSNITNNLKDFILGKDLIKFIKENNNHLIYQQFEYYINMYKLGTQPSIKDIEFLKNINNYVNIKFTQKFSFSYDTLKKVKDISYTFIDNITYSDFKDIYIKNFLK